MGTICISSGSTADQFTKWLAVTYLKDQDPLIIIPGVFQFRIWKTVGLYLEPAESADCICSWSIVDFCGRLHLRENSAERRFVPLRVCAILLASGAIGNLIDRLPGIT